MFGGCGRDVQNQNKCPVGISVNGSDVGPCSATSIEDRFLLITDACRDCRISVGYDALKVLADLR